MKISFKAGLAFSGLSAIFLMISLFFHFYSISSDLGESKLTIFPYAQYVLYSFAFMLFTLAVGIVCLIVGRENKKERNDRFIVTVLPEELKGEKRKVNKLRATGYALYGIGLAIFIFGLIFSYLEATNFLSILVLQGKGQIIFLNNIIPWIVIAIIFWAVATLPVTLSYRHQETEVTA